MSSLEAFVKGEVFLLQPIQRCDNYCGLPTTTEAAGWEVDSKHSDGNGQTSLVWITVGCATVASRAMGPLAVRLQQ